MSKKVCKNCEWQKVIGRRSVAWCMDHMPPVRMEYRETYTPEPMFRTAGEMFRWLDAAEARSGGPATTRLDRTLGP